MIVCLRIREDLSLFLGAWSTHQKPMCLGLCGEAVIGGIKLGQHFTYKSNTTTTYIVVHLHMIFSHWIVLFGIDIIYIN